MLNTKEDSKEVKGPSNDEDQDRSEEKQVKEIGQQETTNGDFFD